MIWQRIGECDQLSHRDSALCTAPAGYPDRFYAQLLLHQRLGDVSG